MKLNKKLRVAEMIRKESNHLVVKFHKTGRKTSRGKCTVCGTDIIITRDHYEYRFVYSGKRMCPNT